MIKHTIGKAQPQPRERKQITFALDTREREPELVLLTIDYRTMPLGSAPAPDHILEVCPVCGLPGARIERTIAPAYYLHAVRIHATRERRKLAELATCLQ